MNPQMLNAVVGDIVYFVRYGHGNIEQALDNAAGCKFYFAQESAIYTGTPDERAEVRAAAAAKLGVEPQVTMTPEKKAAQAAQAAAEAERRRQQQEKQNEYEREFRAKYGDSIDRELELMREMDNPNSDL